MRIMQRNVEFCVETQHLLWDRGKSRENGDGVGWLQEVLDPQRLVFSNSAFQYAISSD